MKSKLLTLIVHIYNNQQLLDLQSKCWQSWENIPGLELIFVDDGSKPKLNLTGLPSWIKKFRVIDDIAWNQPGAKNLASKFSSSDWLFFLDADQFLSKEDMIYLLDQIKNLEQGNIYRFRRFSSLTNVELSSHQNCQIISKSDFTNFGGYDEDFAGFYGFEDAYFERLWIFKGNKIRLLDKPHLVDYSKLETKNLNRDSRRNELLRRKKMLYWHIEKNPFGKKVLAVKSLLNLLLKTKLIADGRPTTQLRFNWEELN